MEDLQLQRLVEDAAGTAADAPAWRQLWRAIEPALWALVDRPRFASHVTHSADARRRIVGAIYARLVADDCLQLQLYLSARRINPRLRFTRWLRTIAKRIGMSYSRYGLQLQT